MARSFLGAGLFCNRLAAQFYSGPYRLVLCLLFGPGLSPELFSGQPQPRPVCNPALLTILPGQARLTARICSGPLDRKSTRLNSSHVARSYAVFCSKKKTANHAFQCV